MAPPSEVACTSSGVKSAWEPLTRAAYAFTNVAEEVGDGDGEGEGEGFGLLTADADAAEPEAEADHPSRPAVIQSRSAAPSAGLRFFMARSPMPRLPGCRGPPSLCHVFGAAGAVYWSPGRALARISAPVLRPLGQANSNRSWRPPHQGTVVSAGRLAW